MKKVSAAMSLFLNAPCKQVTFFEVVPGVRVPVVKHLSDELARRVAGQALVAVFGHSYTNALAYHWGLPEASNSKGGANV